MISLRMGYPDFESEMRMAKRASRVEIRKLVLVKEELLALRESTGSVYMHDVVYDYALSLVRDTRTNQDVACGVSPRGTIALVRMAKAWAMVNGRDYVVPQDVKQQFPFVTAHRLILRQDA